MKHTHNADVNINVDIPTQDLEDLIDKVTEAAVTIVVAVTVAHIFKSFLVR